ncbi:phospholipase A2 inhibitor and Ly6/PLAUR domain-containing protein-like [Mauremys mutica]|uniref:phospholipase A2 inhibitor and Ly6/PLAUR domain-containing protein-like n=1 Tax=Mauremys mutica TaxID=74926 RepID=UPI001D167289|nr:phospholipase A2 inhibitor and Ly6/PLAUR domain-containing protein-like [Mauremys mutica]
MVSFILCLLPALLATSAQAAILTCDTCFGLTETCNFAPGTCQVNKATGGCLSVAEDIKLGGTQNTNFYKECLSNHKSDIEVPISFTVGNGNYVRINTTRCNTDNCNSAVPGVPKGSTTANGLQCPTCFALNFTVCNSSVTPCTGDETYCMDFTGFLYKGSSPLPFQAKGCTTASPQVIKPGAILTTAHTPNTTTTTSATTDTTTNTTTATIPNITTPLNATTTSPTTTTPDTTTTKKTTTIPKATPTPTTTTTTTPTTPPKTNTSPKPALPTQTTRSGASPALGKFSFALYLPGLTGLLLVKLLS